MERMRNQTGRNLMERREVRVREGGSCMHTDERPFSLSLSQGEVNGILYRSSLVVAEWGADCTQHPIIPNNTKLAA
jgi:hypothetical protein